MGRDREGDGKETEAEEEEENTMRKEGGGAVRRMVASVLFREGRRGPLSIVVDN